MVSDAENRTPALRPDAVLSDDAIQYTATALVFRKNLSYDEWNRLGQTLQGIGKAWQWWVGDWLNYGETRWGEKYAQAVDEGLDYQAAADASYVSQQVQFSLRNENLSWSHHKAIAPLGPPDQKEWLDNAETEGWSVSRLREEIKAAGRQVKASEVAALEFDDRYKSLVSDVTDLNVGPVDAIVTDPPYPKEFLPTFAALSETASRVLKPGGLCVVMSGQSYLPEVMAALGSHLDYYWTAAYMLPGQPTPLRQRNVNCSWKPLLVYASGDSSPRIFGDVMRSEQNEKDHHKWGQSESGMADIIDRLTEPGDLILDPFVGGGATVVAALELGRRIIAADIDADQVHIMDNRAAEWYEQA